MIRKWMLVRLLKNRTFVDQHVAAGRIMPINNNISHCTVICVLG